MSGWLTPVATCAAFWLALGLHGSRPGAARFAASLFAGALAAHVG